MTPHCDNSRLLSPWLRAAAAAEYLGVATETLRNWSRKGVIPFVRRGRTVWYHRDALDRWLEAGAGPAPTVPAGS
jgi:excisionase family DNA binding protein